MLVYLSWVNYGCCWHTSWVCWTISETFLSLLFWHPVFLFWDSHEHFSCWMSCCFMTFSRRNAVMFRRDNACIPTRSSHQQPTVVITGTNQYHWLLKVTNAYQAIEAYGTGKSTILTVTNGRLSCWRKKSVMHGLSFLYNRNRKPFCALRNLFFN